jgi:PAS domain S-box-containing protein
MEFSHQRVALAFAASAVGIVVTWLTKHPVGLLAPIAALFLFARGRTVLLLHAASAIGLTGALLVAASHGGAARDLAAAWATFFALALCIGAILAASASAPPDAVAMPAAIRSTTREGAPSYPVTGPTPKEKIAPRNSPTVSIPALDDKTTAARMVAASFWGGTPFHIRYWRRLPDGGHRWTEIRTVPLHEPSGTQRWSGASADIDDQEPAPQQPTKTASNPPDDGDAIRAAKVVEQLLGNAWAFDAAGRPTYLTPIAQTFVALTLDEFQAAVDEGHTFFKCTSHPDDYDRIATAWRHSLQTGDHFYVERRIRRATGIHDWSRTAIVPTRDGQGRITGWYGASIDLDAYRTTELELRDRERELSQLVAMVPSHIWRLTQNGEPIFFNKRMVDFLGLDVADTDKPGRTRLEALIETTIHPDDAAAFSVTLNRSLATGEHFSMRYRLRRADGVYRWMSSRAEPMRDQDGRIIQWYGLCHDIDDQMQAEAALRDRERELSHLVDMVPIPIWRLTSEGEPNFYNKRLMDFFGLETANADRPGMSRLAAIIEAAVHPHDAAGVGQALDHSFATGERFSMKYRLRRADGVYRWVEGRGEPMRDDGGRIAQWYGLIHDIDDELNAQEALRRSERQLQQLIDTVPVQIWCVTPAGEPSYINKTMIEFIGLKLEDFDAEGGLSGAIRTIVHPDDRDALFRTLGHSFSTGEPFAMKFRNRRWDGAYRWQEGHAEPLRDDGGRIIQWYGVNLDIEDETRMQSALRAAQDKLARATQAASLAELSASIAHEVNQPLAAIVANSHACQRWLTAQPPNLERAQKTVERIIRDANGAAEVVSRIRALFRRSIAARVTAALEGIIAESRDLMAEEASRHNVHIEVEIESGLPPVALDRVQVQQVLVNLMRNGMEAMDTVANDKVLTVRARRVADGIQAEVSDRGPGITFPDRMFEPFYTTKEQGMGMGLAICRSIVESHGGRLWTEQNEPHGATFIFTLPVEAETAP